MHGVNFQRDSGHRGILSPGFQERGQESDGGVGRAHAHLQSQCTDFMPLALGGYLHVTTRAGGKAEQYRKEFYFFGNKAQRTV